MIVGNDVLTQSIWLNSHIKVKNKSPYLKNWIEKDIYIINDLLDQNKQIMSNEFFRDTFMLPPQTCHNSRYKENKISYRLTQNPVIIFMDSL